MIQLTQPQFVKNCIFCCSKNIPKEIGEYQQMKVVSVVQFSLKIASPQSYRLAIELDDAPSAPGWETAAATSSHYLFYNVSLRIQIVVYHFASIETHASNPPCHCEEV